MKGPEVERRRFPRFDVDVTPIEVGILEQRTFTGVARDISAGGIAVSLESRIDLKTKILLHFELPGDSISIRCTGVIVWCDHNPKDKGKRFIHGISFTEISDDNSEQITSFVHLHLSILEKEPGSE